MSKWIMKAFCQLMCKLCKKSIIYTSYNDNFYNNKKYYSGGGIDLLAQRGKIKISNTLDARLDMIARQMIPEVRTSLFGRNINRRFTD